MCGIIGIFNNPEAGQKIKRGLEILKKRGKDGYGITDGKKTYFASKPSKLPVLKSRNILGHALHSIVGKIDQPLANCFVANCEIYNWKELNKEYNARNDAELIQRMMEVHGLKPIEQLDGVYAFAFLQEETLWLARDIIGEKPVWYSHSEGFAFASEKKALEDLGYGDIIELNPRQIVVYNLAADKMTFVDRKFFKTDKEVNPEGAQEKVQELLLEAIRKRVPDKKFGLLFSGGVDSTIIAKILKELGCKFNCYTACVGDHAEDLGYAKKAAKQLGLKLKVTHATEKEVPRLLQQAVPLIEDTNVTKVAVALPFFLACRQAHKDGCKVIFSGLGSEEIFAGYQRHKNSSDINKECLSGLLKIYERDLYRDDVITMHNSLELRLPFLDTKLVEYCLRLPARLKLDKERDKIILRNIATKVGVPPEFAERKKRAAQYGSGSMRVIEKLTRKAGLKYKSEFMRRFYPKHNLRLGVLFSGGKDSCYAAYVMNRQNYKVCCLITIESENPDSYMFHTPNIGLTELQAMAMEMPIVKQRTKGIEGLELEDLKKALVTAKKEHKIEGVVTGALYSTYQRSRIEKVADSLGLKIFSPLWHLNQESEMREILNQGFKFIVIKIAADGLDKSWLGKQICQEDVDKLTILHEKNRINIAFEGGEAETLVISGPLFKKRLMIEEAQSEMENKCTGIYNIKKIRLQF
ncbi:MAG: diphthine--ammonia ligase [Candidatus Woesearchaeota archaeon]